MLRQFFGVETTWRSSREEKIEEGKTQKKDLRRVPEQKKKAFQKRKSSGKEFP